MNRAAQEYFHLVAQKNVSGSALHFYRKIKIASDVMSRAAQEHDHLAAINIFSAEMVQDLLCTSTGNQK
jgi:hypothetical protein